MKATLSGRDSSLRLVAALTALFTFFLIVVGATVRVSGSGQGCPDWPLCHGSLIPASDLHTLIEYSHRFVTLIVTVGILATAIMAWLRYRASSLITRVAFLAVVLLFIQAGLGGVVVESELQPALVATHLGNAMLLFASVLIVATLAWRRSRLGTPVQTNIRTTSDFESKEIEKRLPLWLVLASAAGVFIIIVSGSVVEGSGAAEACSSWPLCNGTSLLSPGALPFVHMVHRFIVGVAGLLALFTFYRAMTLYRQNRSIFIVGTFGACALITQIWVGAAQVWLQFPPAVEGAHVAFAAAVWGSLVILALLVRPYKSVETEPRGSGQLSPRRGQEGQGPVSAPLSRVTAEPVKQTPGQVIVAYLMLTKPWIVALLLTTTVAGMLVAARGLPPLNIFVLTLIGGAFAAGGANALNSFIDRDVDKVMGRTSRRPLPSGRVSPRGALIFAVTLSVLSPLVLGLGVNWLSAGLAVIGIIYYAGIYTILLKRATAQNIVVGGAAGAIPPLVGWAAVSGDVSLLALYLFAIILIWTPPHTWALMLLLDKDYNKARIPMLPAAWGQVEARRQIILYSILLVAITLVPVSIGALGLIYLLGALALGIYFLVLAVRLWRNGEAYKPIARKLYHFSNAYLALLFLMMVLDHWLGLFKL